MPPTPSPADSTARQTFTLYATGGRVYASNVDQKLIDLGALTRANDGTLRYVLDGDNTTGEGFADAESALRDMGKKMSFPYLDGQFTALTELRGLNGPGVGDATRVTISLDEPGKKNSYRRA